MLTYLLTYLPAPDPHGTMDDGRLPKQAAYWKVDPSNEDQDTTITYHTAHTATPLLTTLGL